MKHQDSYASTNIKHHRNILLLMVGAPLVVFILVVAIFYSSSKDNYTSAQATCSKTISSGSISAAAGGMSAGQTLCLSGVANFSAGTITKGIKVTTVPGQASRAKVIGYMGLAGNGITMENLYINANGDVRSPFVTGDDITLRNNEIVNIGPTRGICILIGPSDGSIKPKNTVIDGNRIHDCGKVVHDQGIYMAHSINARVTNNYIYDNPDFGIQFYPSAQGSIVENNVFDNNGQGITYSSESGFPIKSNNNIVRNNIITNSFRRYNVEYYWGGGQGSGNQFNNNCVYNGKQGNILGPVGFTVSGTTVADPMYVDRAGKDFRLKSGSPCTGKGPQSSAVTPTSPPVTTTPNPTPQPTTPTPSSPSASSGSSLGSTTVGSGWTSMSPDAKRGSRFTYSGSTGVELYQISGFLRGASGVSGSQTVNVAVYSDNSGQPGSLLAQGVSARSVPAGQAAARSDFALNKTVALTPGTNYWLMYHSGGAAGVAEYSHNSVSGALKWQSSGTDSFSDGPSADAGSFNTDNKSAVIWGQIRTIASTSSPSPSPSPSGTPFTPLPPISIPDSNPTTPVSIPAELPTNSDGSYTGDFNGDGLNDIAKDLNSDGRIDPTSEIVVDGTANPELTDTSQAPITPDNYSSLFYNNNFDNQAAADTSTVTVKAGPLPEVKIPKPVAYTFLTAGTITLAGVGAYLAVTKLALFAAFRAKWGL